MIGAGPSGIAVGACLQQRRIDFVILEKEHQVGSSWRRHYERLHLHTIKSRSSLPFRSFDRNYPRYVPRSLVVRYLEEYAASFNLTPRFGENVHAVRKQGNGWLIESTSKAFSAPNLVVASGLNAEPVRPEVPGGEKFGRAYPPRWSLCQCNTVQGSARFGCWHGEYRGGNRPRPM